VSEEHAEGLSEPLGWPETKAGWLQEDTVRSHWSGRQYQIIYFLELLAWHSFFPYDEIVISVQIKARSLQQMQFSSDRNLLLII